MKRRSEKSESQPDTASEVEARESEFETLPLGLQAALLAREITANLAVMASDYLKVTGLSRREIEICTVVAYRPGITVSDLTRDFGQSKQAISQLVTGLVSKRFLTQEQDPADRRRRRLAPGSALHPHATVLMNRYASVYAQGLQDFNSEQQSLVLAALERIRQVSREQVR